MPGLSGLELCKLLRQRSDTSRLPILMLTAKDTIQDRVQLVHFAGGIQGLDPATGEVLWFCRGVTAGQSSPVYGSCLIYADAGRGGSTSVV